MTPVFSTVVFLTLDVGVLGVVHLLSQLLHTLLQPAGLVSQRVQISIGGVGVAVEKVQGLLRCVQLPVQVGHHTAGEARQ